MSDEPKLTPAKPEDLAFALAFALQFRSRSAKPQAVGLVAQITAAYLVEYLARSGFVVMQKRPVRDSAPVPPSTPG